ncbi:hypothetical protein BFP72_06915 [Reichenbachiella sp. 5M10]|nr:hypothetical protein BFP72_06915 [Reichenbachiella sp. 5M10]
MSTHRSVGQDPTIYVSPHNIDQTLSNVYVGIDRNSHKYINTLYYQADSTGIGEFVGSVYVVEFSMDHIEDLVSCEPTVAFDLPLKIMIWEEQGDVYLSYVNPFVFKRRYFIKGCDELLDQVNKAMIRIVNDAIRTN